MLGMSRNGAPCSFRSERRTAKNHPFVVIHPLRPFAESRPASRKPRTGLNDQDGGALLPSPSQFSASPSNAILLQNTAAFFVIQADQMNAFPLQIIPRHSDYFVLCVGHAEEAHNQNT